MVSLETNQAPCPQLRRCLLHCFRSISWSFSTACIYWLFKLGANVLGVVLCIYSIRQLQYNDSSLKQGRLLTIFFQVVPFQQLYIHSEICVGRVVPLQSFIIVYTCIVICSVSRKWNTIDQWRSTNSVRQAAFMLCFLFVSFSHQCIFLGYIL